ncbi:PIG-L deacetylase family protein [Methylopila sp. Yamaguchi]|uniref:PIG-L deacetylase family protein n=1 Tax=Methylopila sp. Yamaguchi TaxID=1437817 RepID=UPI000CC1D9E9|nr:PIG-L family deacetylase [Methylopila sp. Yamaguchi]GBD48567.1 LmbE family protein [Methylopila sp. Yamaguchi]
MTAAAVDLLQARSLFVSPHYDDVPLSCGGVVAALAERGWAPRMVTVFASELVDAMVGEFAAWKHARWRLEEPDSVLSTRRAEDAAAAKTLGCEARWLGLPDAIYRGDRYTSDQELFGRLHAEEEELGEVLADELTQLPEWRDGDRVFVPLGIGSHVDHQLVFEAGRRLARRGVEVFAYEDCPYAIHTPEGVDRRLDAVRDHVAEPVLVPIGAAIEPRLDAIACYRSQIPVIFRFTDDFRSAVRAFALDRGGLRGPAERFWPVLS